MEKTEIPNEKIKIRNANKSQAENSEPICEDEDKNEENEVEAAEKVINAMLYYQKHALLKFKKATDSAKFEYRFDRVYLLSVFQTVTGFNATARLRKIGKSHKK